ncbi:MAG TPA: site-2 protease family protein [Acidobacteriaceae bacterium]|nr:site-2 protease family protein [Acidobacteriaceae bacterium]
MRGIRSFLAMVYGFVAVMFLYRMAAGLLQHHAAAPTLPTHPVAPWLKLAGEALTPAMIVIFGMASLSYFLRRPSARVWGVLAGLMNLALAVAVFVTLRTFTHAHMGRLIQDQALLVLMGIGSIAVFAVWNPATDGGRAAQVKPRVKGDGTSAVLDAIPFILTIAGYIVGMNLWYRWGQAQGLEWGASGWFWPDLLAAALITTFVHECGHALTARVLGMQIRGFSAGPLQWRVRSGRWQFNFRWSGLLSAEGATIFDLNDPALVKGKAIAMVAAGPIANLFLGVAATWAVLHAVDAPWEQAWLLLAFVSTFSLIAFVVNFIPARSGQTYTDGAKIWQLLTGRRWEEFHGTGDEVARRKGLDYLMAGQAVEAEAQFRTALGDGRGLARESHVRLLVCLADALQDQERFAEAKGYLETALQLGDDTGSGQGSMADILLLLGNDPQRALSVAAEACRLNIERIRKRQAVANEEQARVRLLARQAQAYAQLDERSQADRAIGEATRMVDAALAARTQAQGRSPQGAELVFGRPSNSFDDLLLAYSCYMVGRALGQMDRDDQAAKVLRTARDLDPKGTIRLRAQRELDRMGVLAWR